MSPETQLWFISSMQTLVIVAGIVQPYRKNHSLIREMQAAIEESRRRAEQNACGNEVPVFID
jgi:hypothetical protein